MLAAIRRVLADILRRIKGVLPATKTRSLSNVVKQIDALLEAASAAQEQATVETTANKDEELQYSVNDSIVVNSNFDELPTSRNEALKMIEKLREKAARTNEDGLPYFVNNQTKRKIFVSNGDVRHAMMYHNIDQIKAIGVYDKIIGNV